MNKLFEKRIITTAFIVAALIILGAIVMPKGPSTWHTDAFNPLDTVQSIESDARQVGFHNEPTPSAPYAIGLSTIDAYARAQGYRDWNHYLEHRPSNKNGERKPEEIDHSGDQAYLLSLVKPKPETLPQTCDACVSTAQVNEEEIVDAAEDDPVYINRYRYRDAVYVRYVDTPMYVPSSVAVPEPSALPLMLTGVLGLIATRRARK